MQLFRADATIFLKQFKFFFAHENMKKKVTHNQPNFFPLLPTGSNQPKSQFMFHKNCSPRDLCIMTLLIAMRLL
jgi:hypothetical protein